MHFKKRGLSLEHTNHPREIKLMFRCAQIHIFGVASSISFKRTFQMLAFPKNYICFRLKMNMFTINLPEFPDVSIPVPNKSTYSVREA